ncbi:hypothetical protein [Halopseudomonas sp.]|uniref:hypothetical protein n=1 Tax=Halopseudomonas sp. TaxID=2901191 RepID=UPI00311FA86F
MPHRLDALTGSRLLWASAMLATLQACSVSQPQEPASGHIERELLSHTLHIETGEPRVLDTPHRNIRISESRLFRVSQYDAGGNLLDQHRQYQSLPWANRPVGVQLGELSVQRETDSEGQFRLNLLDEDIVPVDFDQLRTIELEARHSTEVHAEAILLVDRELRIVLHEASELIYDNLEEDDVEQWVQRINRLSELGLKEEASQLENMLILLTTGDPHLQDDFIQALDQRDQPQD